MTNDRTKSIGGSDAPVLMKGDHFGKTPALLWEEKTGRRQPEDLSRVLRVQMGIWTEQGHGEWYEQETAFKLIRPVDTLYHPEYPFISANLDGYTMGTMGRGLWEAKHISAFSKADAVEGYYAQLQHYMLVADLEWAHLSVLKGTADWAYYEVERDEGYIEELVKRERAFWKAVMDDQMPKEWQTVEAPKVEATKTADMTGNNEWASHAAGWLEHKADAATFAIDAAGLKALVEADVSRAHGHGVQITRAKNGALTVREDET